MTYLSRSASLVRQLVATVSGYNIVELFRTLPKRDGHLAIRLRPTSNIGGLSNG